MSLIHRQLTDEQLAKQIATGSHRAFDEIVRRFHQKLYRVAWRQVFNQEAAEDIAQEALIKLWKRADLFDPSKAKLSTWLYRVTLNAATDYLRKQRMQTQEIQEGDWVAQETMTDEIAADEERILMLNAVIELSEPQQQVINLFYFEGLSTAETAEAMELTPKAVEGHLARARKALKPFLTEHWETQYA